MNRILLLTSRTQMTTLAHWRWLFPYRYVIPYQQGTMKSLSSARSTEVMDQALLANRKILDDADDPSRSMTLFLQRLHPDSIVRVHCGEDGSTPPRFVTAYWSIRGLGAPIRMLLASTMIPHWVLLYDVVECDQPQDGGWDKSSWIKTDKTWLSNEVTPLINLPYLVDFKATTGSAPRDKASPLVISHSNAILLYLDRVVLSQRCPNDVCFKTISTTSLVEQLLFEIMDLRDAMIDFAYHQPTTDTDANLVADATHLVEKRARPLLQRLEKYLEFSTMRCDNNSLMDSDEKCHLIQGRISAPDFHLFEMLDQFHGLCSRVLGAGGGHDDDTLFGSTDLGCSKASPLSFPNLARFWRSFPIQTANRLYFTSILHQLPYNNPYARFGSDPTSLRSYVRKQAAPWRNVGLVDIP